ncbi:MAG TPA: phenylacetic acid degradation protein PaaN [Rhodocyclaceae bacterium]|nr:phenylacetic acid degradation protein PaaN [Rhodocyclaceae bacterium]
MSHPMFEKHRNLLEDAVRAIRARGCWSPWPEHPKAYGDGALEAGREAFDAYREANFYLDQPGLVDRIGAELSPFGLPLDIRYPRCRPAALVAAAKAAMPAWTRAGGDARAGVCAEILARLNAHSPELAHAAMHTTGQPLMMAFQGAGPHAQERGLEAVALAWREMREIPETAVWEKPQGRNPPLRLEKRYLVVPRGVGLVIGCSTFPTWNAYPGLFASLATGNPVIVKPHPGAILPLAITVAAARMTLKDAGFDPNLVSLLVDEPDAPVTRDVALLPDIRVIDYTGSSAFGTWLEENARQARVFAEKAGVNCVVVDSTDDYGGLLQNLAFSLCLYSGQMCTAPQAIFVPRAGISTPAGSVDPQRFGVDLSQAVGRLLEDDARAVEILGAIQSPATLARLEALGGHGEELRESRPLRHPVWPEARVVTPLLLRVDVAEEVLYGEERFGPAAFVVEAATTAESLAATERLVREKGAITLLIHSTNPHVRDLAEELALRAGVSLSFNLTDGVFVNQSAAFSDFHATGANPAAGACLTDAAFVAGRFFVVQTRRHL